MDPLTDQARARAAADAAARASYGRLLALLAATVADARRWAGGADDDARTLDPLAWGPVVKAAPTTA